MPRRIKQELPSVLVPAEASYSNFQLATTAVETLQRIHPDASRILIFGLDARLVQPSLPRCEITSGEVSAPAWTSEKSPQLPYKDREFDAVVACDCLNSLPDAARKTFLRELARVVKRVVVLISPFESPLTATAEESVNEIYRAVHRRHHPRLAGHREHGLPDLRQTTKTIQEAMGQPPEVIGNTALRSWALFEMLEAATAAFDRNSSVLLRLNQYFNSTLARMDHTAPLYRHLIIADKTSLKKTVTNPLRKRFESSTAENEIRVVRDMLRLVLDGLTDVLAAPRKEGVLADTLKRMEELERKNRAMARTIEKLQAELYGQKAPDAGKSGRIIKKLFTF